MTYEQWIIYLYGIYPGKGWALIIFLWFTTSLGTLILVKIIAKDELDKDATIFLSRYAKTFWVALVILIVSGFMPDRKTFAAIIATPIIVESVKKEDGKLYKVDMIIDRVLDKTLKELEKD